jgi:hypothetical protein
MRNLSAVFLRPNARLYEINSLYLRTFSPYIDTQKYKQGRMVFNTLISIV